MSQMQIRETFKLLSSVEDYIFIDSHPVDTRNSKYNILKTWYNRHQLYCFACDKKASHFELKQCKGHGNIHKETKKIKYYLNLCLDDGAVISLDHWYPKAFIKKYDLKLSK